MLATIQAIGSIIIAAGTIINYYLSRRNHTVQLEMKATLLELQLNMRREFNGTYISITRFEDLKERVKRLEEVSD